jgi:molecular chaperone GrpE
MQDPNASPEQNAQSDDVAVSATEVPDSETTPTLEEQLAAAELKATEHQEAWLRAKAETENMRRRAQEDIAKAGKFAIERFAGELLAVKDSLEAALANIANPANQSAENLKSGVELTLRQLTSAFEKSNLVEINPVGEKFDPHKHQAISQIETADDATPPNTVINVLQKGYSLYERIIRPALVVIAKAKTPPAAAGEQAT